MMTGRTPNIDRLARHSFAALLALNYVRLSVARFGSGSRRSRFCKLTIDEQPST
jgi:hypothetical protein